jgi:hypothetical protein
MRDLLPERLRVIAGLCSRAGDADLAGQAAASPHPQHSRDLLRPGPIREVLPLPEQHGDDLFPDQQARVWLPCNEVVPQSYLISSIIFLCGFNTADLAIYLKKSHLITPT